MADSGWKSVSETSAVCQCICVTGERRWASVGRIPGAGGRAWRRFLGGAERQDSPKRARLRNRGGLPGFPSACYAAS